MAYKSWSTSDNTTTGYQSWIGQKQLPPIEQNLLTGPTDQAVQPIQTSNRGNASYIVQKSQELGLDPRAVLGVAQNEGMSGGVGDKGTSFGPFQLHAGGALPQEVWQQGPETAQNWAWSQAGIDYALGKMADSAHGLTGADAVRAIVLNFERPANPTGDLQAGYRSVGIGN